MLTLLIMVAEVIINRTAKKLNRTFDYKIPQRLEDIITVGSKVLVPFGKGEKLEEAFVIKIKQSSSFDVKEIEKLEENLNDSQIMLARWMAKRYFCNVSDCINLMLTPGTRSKTKENRIKDKKVNVVGLKIDIERIENEINEGKIKSEKHIKIIEFLKENGYATIPEIERNTQCSRAIVNTLIKNGYLELQERIIARNPLEYKQIEKTSFLKFTDEQEKAYLQVEKSLINNEYKRFLLYGVTGSRKD